VFPVIFNLDVFTGITQACLSNAGYPVESNNNPIDIL